MYGLLNAALKEFVVATHGASSWDLIAQSAAVSVDHFNKMDPYPDEIAYRIVAATATTTGRTTDEVLDGFGEYWVHYTASQGYAPLFEIAGDSLRDFLLSLDDLHARIGRSFPKLVPPSFRFDPIDPMTLRMHYISQRKGLCPMVPGLLRGLSDRFQTPLRVDHDRCARRGADHCEFVVAFQPKSSWQPSIK
jgi:predicted hydrocarbon binding protein